jgi:hypothetical protein
MTSKANCSDSHIYGPWPALPDPDTSAVATIEVAVPDRFYRPMGVIRTLPYARRSFQLAWCYGTCLANAHSVWVEVEYQETSNE